ncbi:MAG: membrane dipeptidase [Clostridia bacterium]|nr:membrane dipeptidase [Clostridia bacterium]
MKYFDLHADTPLAIHAFDVTFDSDKLNLCSKYFASFESFAQFAAFCPPHELSDSESYDRFFKVRERFLGECEKKGFSVCTSRSSLKESLDSGRPAFILTVEDARLLDSDISKLDVLYSSGVRLITPLWGGRTVIGSSFECDGGLTDFGKDVLRRCGELGIATDVSHASPSSADEIIDTAREYNMPVVASHSCAYSVNSHPRNLRESHLRRIAETDGLVGVNFYPPHLNGESANISDVAGHIDYYVNCVGEDHVAIGSDFDGMGIYTFGLENLGCIPSLREKLKDHGYSEAALDKIFFSNALSFAERILK